MPRLLCWKIDFVPFLILLDFLRLFLRFVYFFLHFLVFESQQLNSVLQRLHIFFCFFAHYGIFKHLRAHLFGRNSSQIARGSIALPAHMRGVLQLILRGKRLVHRRAFACGLGPRGLLLRGGNWAWLLRGCDWLLLPNWAALRLVVVGVWRLLERLSDWRILSCGLLLVLRLLLLYLVLLMLWELNLFWWRGRLLLWFQIWTSLRSLFWKRRSSKGDWLRRGSLFYWRGLSTTVTGTKHN